MTVVEILDNGHVDVAAKLPSASAKRPVNGLRDRLTYSADDGVKGVWFRTLMSIPYRSRKSMAKCIWPDGFLGVTAILSSTSSHHASDTHA